MKFHWRELVQYLVRKARETDPDYLIPSHSPDEWIQDINRLILRRLDLKPADRYTRREFDISRSQLDALIQDARNLKMDMPLAYVLNEADFGGETFYVNPDVLIPRPDSEILVEAAWEAFLMLQRSHSGKLPVRIVDVGTGSGCLIIVLAKRIINHLQNTDGGSDLRVDLLGVDISPAALRVARRNAASILGSEESTQDHVTWSFVRNDGVPAGQAWSVVMTNPPYVTSREMMELDLSVALYEPWLALDGGTDGLGPFTRIARGARDTLSPGGLLLCEHGPDQAEAMQRIAAIYLELRFIGVRQDLAGRDRVSAWMYNGIR